MRREEVIRLLGKQKRNFWELLSRWEYRLEDFVTTLNAMHAAGEVIVEDNCLQLSPALQATAPQTLEEGKCPACAGRGMVGTNSQLLQEFQRLLQERPLTTAKYFQGNMDAESVVARVHLMDMRDGLAGKRITLVGDDDYLSLALALTRLPARIVVLEVDERIGEFLCRCRQQYDLPIEYIPYNVTDPLPPELREQSDLFST
ncbi:MAG: putative methyltransferase, partial [Nitrospinota bacterium]